MQCADSDSWYKQIKLGKDIFDTVGEIWIRTGYLDIKELILILEVR